MKKLSILLAAIITISPFCADAFPAINKIKNTEKEDFFELELGNTTRYQTKGTVYYKFTIPSLNCSIDILEEEDMIYSKCCITETEKKDENFSLDNDDGLFYQVSHSTVYIDDNYYAYYFDQGFVLFNNILRDGCICLSKSFSKD